MSGPPPLPDLPGVRHRDVLVDGVRLHVAEAGPQDAPAVVMQHGWPQNWWCWRALIEPLAGEHRVICPDLRGLGWSQAPRGGYDKERLAADLIGVLDELGLQRVKLVGHDWGGYAGFLACLRAPERFSSFLALSIVHPWPQAEGVPDPRQLARLWYQAVISTPVIGGRLVRHGARRILDAAGSRSWDERTREIYAQTLSSDAGVHATVAIYRTFLTRELIPVARGRYKNSRLRVPTHLMVGEHDPVITPEAVAGYDKHADEMTHEFLPDVAHWVPEERPREVLEALARLP